MRDAHRLRMVSRARILVASAQAIELAALADWLASDGFDPVRLATLDRLMDEIGGRAFDAVVVDRALACRPGQQMISAVRARNARTPIVVVGDADAASEAQVLSRGGIYLTRPLDRVAFLCMVSMSVMEARPERRSPRKPVSRLEAVVEGVPSHIIDVSNEGLRLEVPRTRKSAPPPPVFSVRVPLLGISLLARRMWTANPPGNSPDVVWYGAEVFRNSQRVMLAWRTLVDTLPAGGMALEIR
jgi:hypothetical protein